MDIRELIDDAAKSSGQTQAQIADELGVKPARLSEWKSGVRKPDANEIAYFANKAGLPVLKTVAEIEASMNSRYASIWQEALTKLRAAGVTASVLVAVTAGSFAVPADSHAAGLEGFKNVRFRQHCAPDENQGRFCFALLFFAVGSGLCGSAAKPQAGKVNVHRVSTRFQQVESLRVEQPVLDQAVNQCVQTLRGQCA